MNSSGASDVRPGPVAMVSTGTSRRPFEPATTQIARAAMSAGTLSAAGEALPRLPAGRARAARGPGTPADGARADAPRHAVGRGRAVAQVAGERRASLDLGRAD